MDEHLSEIKRLWPSLDWKIDQYSKHGNPEHQLCAPSGEALVEVVPPHTLDPYWYARIWFDEYGVSSGPQDTLRAAVAAVWREWQRQIGALKGPDVQ